MFKCACIHLKLWYGDVASKFSQNETKNKTFQSTKKVFYDLPKRKNIQNFSKNLFFSVLPKRKKLKI